MTARVELADCPFCGESNAVICATHFKGEDREAFAVTCRTRECHGVIFTLGYGLFDSREKAIAAWNTQASPDAAVREALRPFAQLAEFVSEAHRDSRPLVHGLDLPVIERLTIGHLRAAKAALSPAVADGRDEIARVFLYETGAFDSPAEIAANPEHHLVKAAYRAADRLSQAQGPGEPVTRPERGEDR